MKQGNNKDKTQHNGYISKKMNVSMEEGTRVTHILMGTWFVPYIVIFSISYKIYKFDMFNI